MLDAFLPLKGVAITKYTVLQFDQQTLLIKSKHCFCSREANDVSKSEVLGGLKIFGASSTPHQNDQKRAK